MRFAGCCNISCKRIDAVEHSDDLGASRKGRNLPTAEKQSTLQKAAVIVSPQRRGSKKIQSNAPGPKDLDALACRLAERVRPRLRSTKAKGTEKPYHVEVHGGFLYWTKCKPDGESRAGHTRVVVLSGADVAGDAEGVRVTLPVPDPGRRSSLGAATTMATDMIAVTGATKSSQAPSTVYLRVCDRVADKKDLAKKWAEALAAGAEKQQPLGGYRGEDVAAKNPFTKALAARGRLAVAS